MKETMLSAEGKPFAPPILSEQVMQTRAHRDAMRAIARDIPNPKKYARYLDLHFVEALMAAENHTPGGIASGGGLRVSAEMAPPMQAYGLVEAGTGSRYLTAFGLAVRRALVAEDA